MTPIFALVFTIALIISGTMLLVLITNYYDQKKIGKMLKAFNEATAEFNLSVSKQDLLGNRVIGLDETNRNLLYFSAENKKYDGYVVDLDDVKSASLKKEYGKSFAGYTRKLGPASTVDRIELQLDYRNGNTPLVLPFYERAEDGEEDLAQRSALAEEWQGILSEMLLNNNETLERRQIKVKTKLVRA